MTADQLRRYIAEAERHKQMNLNVCCSSDEYIALCRLAVAAMELDAAQRDGETYADNAYTTALHELENLP